MRIHSQRLTSAVLALATSATLSLLVSCEAHSNSEQYFLVSANIKLPYWQAANAGFSKALAQEGVKGEMVGPNTFDPQAEVTEFRNALAKKPAGILVSVTDPNLLQPEINAAISQGVPVITIDSDAPDSQRLFFIGTNNIAAGRLGAQTLVQKLGGRGNVVFFGMPGQPNIDDRLRGYKSVLVDSPGIKIVDVVDIRGDSRVAFDKTTEYASKTGGDKVDAFVCLEASAGKDVAEALKRANATAGRTIVAMDTDDATLKLVQDGTIAATIAQKPYTMAYFGLRSLADIHLEKKPDMGGAYSTDPDSPYPALVDTGSALVTKTNVDQYLNKSSQ